MKLILTHLLLLTYLLTHGQSLENFSETSIRGPWQLPVGIAFDENGQGYIWDMNGKVYVLDTSEQVIRTPLLDISEEVSRWLDQGMTGFALDPSFKDNGHFYVMYPVDQHYDKFFGTADYNPRKTDTHTATYGRITRFTADPAQNFQQLIPNSRKVILGKEAEDGFPILFDSHGLGALAFGEDGTLLASCGDGANSVWIDIGSNGGSYFQDGLKKDIITEEENIGAYRSQMIQSLAGKIIRIDPASGAGVDSNPFFDPENPFAPQSRIWSLGLRNPFSLLVLPETGSHIAAEGQPGTILCGDVGEFLWEEIIAFDKGGQNAGWPIYEGFEINPTYGEVKVENPYAPNENQNEDCKQAFFNFHDLLAEDANPPELPTLPCNPTQGFPQRIPSFIHHRPILTYQNQDDKGQTKAFAAIPSFNENGQASFLSIEAKEANVAGQHFQGDASIVGFYYEEGPLPERWHQTLFLVDYRGWIRTFKLNEQNQVIETAPFYEGIDRIVAAAAVPGESAVYFISLADRRLHKLEYGGRRRPKAQIKSNQTFGKSPLSIRLDAGASIAYDSPLNYEWDLGNGSISNDSIVEVSYQDPTQTTIAVELTVRDTFGGMDSTSQKIFLNNTPPIINWISPQRDERYPIQGTNLIRLEAKATDLESNNDELTYEWEIFLHHNTHFHPSSVQNESLSFALLSPLGCGLEDYWYRVELRVSDPQGLSQKESRLIWPNCEDPTPRNITLKAFAQQNRVQLKWEIDNTEGVQEYELERSMDFFHFSSITKNTSNQFRDLPPGRGTFIYRIKAIGEDGRFWYSNLIARDLPSSNNFKVFPNPSKHQFSLELTDVDGDSFDLYLFDSWGRMVKHFQRAAKPTNSAIYDFASNDLVSGTYFYQIIDASQRFTGKLIIER